MSKQISIKQLIKTFLLERKTVSPGTYIRYANGIEPLSLFLSNYFEASHSGAVLPEDIEPADIDHVFSYFVIRKFMDGTTLRVNTAISTAAFFSYLANRGLYDKSNASEIKKMAIHYRKQYPRISKLEDSLYQATEGEIDRLMKLSKKQQAEKLSQLRQDAQDQVLKDVGYVSIERVEAGFVYGKYLTDESSEIGPVKLDDTSLALLEIGDIINMITVSKKPHADFWEIAELGYVYPRPYCED